MKSLLSFLLSINECYISGLVHKSQMSSNRIEHPEEMVEKGERVFCKVISVDVSHILSQYGSFSRSLFVQNLSKHKKDNGYQGDYSTYVLSQFLDFKVFLETCPMP